MKCTPDPLSSINCQLSSILVFGGTTEGKKVAALLEKERCHYVYSTKTKIDFEMGKYGSYRYGAFTKETLVSFCNEHQIQKIIHASHPFAEELHETIHQASIQLNIPVIRFERSYPERINHKLIHYFPSYEKAITHLIDHKIQNLLALTGVQTIEKLRPYWQLYPTRFRILPRQSSVALAEQAGFPKENLILAFPTADLQQELDNIQQNNIKALLTKESGDSGFLNTKIEAALQLKIPLLIIERGVLPASFILVYTEEEIMAAILKTEAVSSVEGREGST